VYDEPRARGAETAASGVRSGSKRPAPGRPRAPAGARGTLRPCAAGLTGRRGDESVVRAAGRRGAGAPPAEVRLV